MRERPARFGFPRTPSSARIRHPIPPIRPFMQSSACFNSVWSSPSPDALPYPEQTGSSQFVGLCTICTKFLECTKNVQRKNDSIASLFTKFVHLYVFSVNIYVMCVCARRKSSFQKKMYPRGKNVQIDKEGILARYSVIIRLYIFCT